MGWRDVFDRLLGEALALTASRPALPPMPIEPELARKAESLFGRYAQEAAAREYTYDERFKASTLTAGQQILAGDDALQVAVLLVGIGSLAAADCLEYRVEGWIAALVTQILRRNLPYAQSHLAALVHCAAYSHSAAWKPPWKSILAHVERATRSNAAGADLCAALNQARDRLSQYFGNQKLIARIGQILKHGDTDKAAIVIIPGEAWLDLALSELGALDASEKDAWYALLLHAEKAKGSKPSDRFMKTAAEVCQRIGNEHVAERLARWLDQVGQPGEFPIRRNVSSDHEQIKTLICDNNAELLKGLVWCSAAVREPSLTMAVGRCAEACYKKIPQHGARCVKLGNACVQSLAALGTPDAVAQISRVKSRVKYASVQSLIQNALAAAAAKAGVSTDELEEIAVPSYGLDESGIGREVLGNFTGQIVITGTTAVDLEWIKQDNKTQKSVPKAVKEEHPEELKELQRTVADLKKMLPAHRDRIENSYLEQRVWPMARWKERYLDHPLMQHLSRRLIWSFARDGQTKAGIWHDGVIVSSESVPLEGLDEETQVMLWHPIGHPSEAVSAWRNWLAEHEVTQPFKQGHRELYVLTDAERQTESYSNRFAAHIIKQHQFSALCQQRGWRYTLQGQWDSHNVPEKQLPRWDLVAEFRVESGWDEGAAASNMGIFLYLGTDQVRFFRTGEAEPMPLEYVPPLAFSEVMRDVDLFVGVASVANDPTWADTGPRGHRNYWEHFSFGDLSTTGHTRREVLVGILPKLKIADRCHIEDRFLIVAGDLRTYKIHLGSGNIMMSPNDQYLCIVPSRGAGAPIAGGKVFLPFEGDRTLSIILSKAFLLADDRNIKDRTIRAQIQ